jgi:hypothetical protein
MHSVNSRQRQVPTRRKFAAALPLFLGASASREAEARVTMRTYRRGKIWYARLLAGDRMLPVRMEFETGSAAVKGYLAEFRGRGVDLHLMRE